MISRQLKEAGFNPVLGISLLVIGFSAFSRFLFQKTEYAGYIYVFTALSVIVKLSERKRAEFLKISFKDLGWMKIRLAENLIAAVPFVVFLCYKQLFLFAFLLMILVSLMAITSFRTRFNSTIPTPFSGKPFEFTVGFRNTFYLFLGIYILTFIAIKVDNFNLGVFSMLLVFAFSMSYYAKPEDELFVWIHSLTPKEFLFEKMKPALKYSTLLNLPVIIALGIFYPFDLHFIGLFLLLGYLFLICMILAKYSVYPNEMNLVEVILIAFCVAFSPLLLIIIPYFYSKSMKSLNHLLK